jgi:hypothetical protein
LTVTTDIGHIARSYRLGVALRIAQRAAMPTVVAVKPPRSGVVPVAENWEVHSHAKMHED